MKINNVEVEVLIKGRPVRVFPFNGKMFIEARYGSEYEIRIKNNNYYRIMAVCSVDGLSVLDGKEATKDGAGYVINAYSSYEIKGFRSDNNTVGAFKFTKKKNGYAKEVTGSSQNSGIIGVAVFAEKVNYILPTYSTTTFVKTVDSSSPWWQSPSWTCMNTAGKNLNDDNLVIGSSLNGSYNNSVNHFYNHATETFRGSASRESESRRISINSIPTTTACSYSAPKEEAPDFNAATTWGSKITDSVKTVEFEKASSYPMAEFEIFYDIKPNLEKIGIVLESQKQVYIPKSFPSAFAKPPSGWGN